MGNVEPFLTNEVKQDLFAHLHAEAPKECCGFIVLERGQYKYERLRNMSKTPETAFKLSKENTARASISDNVIAICHSHPHGHVSPSKLDMHAQIAVNKPFVIAVKQKGTGVVAAYSFGDHMLDYDLMRRPWLYGVFDCFEATRSWAWQNQGIYIPRGPRTDWWWVPERQDEVEEEDRDIYGRGIDRNGYAEYPVNLHDPNSVFHPKIGDVLFMQIGSPYVNHTAVYVGENQIYHHRQGKLSDINPLGYIIDRNYVRKWTRHKSLMP